MRTVDVEIPVLVGSNGKWVANGYTSTKDDCANWAFMADSLEGDDGKYLIMSATPTQDEAAALERADRLIAEGITGDRGQIASIILEAVWHEREACANIALACDEEDERDNGAAMTGAAGRVVELIHARST